MATRPPRRALPVLRPRRRGSRRALVGGLGNVRQTRTRHQYLRISHRARRLRRKEEVGARPGRHSASISPASPAARAGSIPPASKPRPPVLAPALSPAPGHSPAPPARRAAYRPRRGIPPASKPPVGARPHRQGKLPGALEHALTGPRPLSRRPHGPPGPGSGRRHGPVPAAGVGEKNSPPASNALSRAAYGPCGPHPPGSSPGKRQEGRCGPPGQEAPPPGRNRRQPPHAPLPASRFVAISGAPGDHATNPGGVDPRRPGAYLFLAGRRRREAHG